MEEDDNEDDCLDSNNTLNEEGHDTDQDEAVEIVEIYKMEHSKQQAFYCKTNLKWAWERCHALQPSP